MNKEKYLLLLVDHLETCFIKCKLTNRHCTKREFQRDGASCHTAKIIGEYLDFVHIEYIKPCPVGRVTGNKNQKFRNGISYFYVVGFKNTYDVIFFWKKSSFDMWKGGQKFVNAI